MPGLLFSLLLMQPIIESGSGRTRTRRRGEKAAGRGGRLRGPLLHLLLAGRWEAATAALPARDALLEEEGIPGRLHPAASHSPPLAADPAPPLPTGADARGAGVAATCARPLTGTRALLPAWSAFRRGSSARGLPAAGRPGSVAPTGPTWRRGPGGFLRGREEKAAPACGSLPACGPTIATGEAGLRLGHRNTEGGALFWEGDRSWGFFGERLTVHFSASCLCNLCH